MKIGYISHARYPSEKAYGVQVTRVCEAMERLGNDVTLVAPGVHNEVRESYVDYYDVRHLFSVTHLPTKDALLSWWIPGRFAMLSTMRSYGNSLREHLRSHSYDVLYARSPYVLSELLRTNSKVVLELHTLPRRGKHMFVENCTRCALVVCLTRAMKEELVQWGVPESKLVVEADAVDIERFANVSATTFSLPKGRPVVGYVGSLQTLDSVQKGADMLVDCAKQWNNNHNAFVWVVGGPITAADELREHAIGLGLTKEEVRIEGPVPSKTVASVIQSCDVCVYPAPKSNHPYFMRDTSPLKLFEYLAAGVPTVCADIPPVRDIVDETSVWFFSPGDAAGLAQAVDSALLKTKEAAAKAAKDKEIAAYHTWEKRMQRILTAISEL